MRRTESSRSRGPRASRKSTKAPNILFATANAIELTKILPPNSVDYIFTDPPYGGAVQYFELSTLWAAWLNMKIDYADEITINSQQKKDFDYYHKMLKSAFREMYQVLKPGQISDGDFPQHGNRRLEFHH